MARTSSRPTWIGCPKKAWSFHSTWSVATHANPLPSVIERPRWCETGKSEPYRSRRGPNSSRMATMGSASQIAEVSNQTFGRPRREAIDLVVLGPWKPRAACARMS